jgi:transposase-like protein
MSDTNTCCGVISARFGRDRKGQPRLRCRVCRKTRVLLTPRLFGQMTVSEEKGLLALQLLLEGNSIRSTERIVGIDRNTIMRLLVVAGQRAAHLLHTRVQNVPVEHLELDEVWAYVGCHQKYVRPDDENPRQRGDQYTFIALESETKMVMAFHLGKRDGENTRQFIAKVRHATSADKLF